MDILIIVPNDTVSIDIQNQESFLSLLVDAGDDVVCRAVISDQVGYGVVLPAAINQQEKTITFVLPEQLCIFSPETTYLIKIETISEVQLMSTIANSPIDSSWLLRQVLKNGNYFKKFW